MSMVPSVDALSTTTISLRRYRWASTDSRQRLMKRPLLNVTIVTETKSFCAMNKNLRTVLPRQPAKLAGGARYSHFVSPAGQQTSTGKPCNLSVSRPGLQAPAAGGFGQHPQKRAHQHGQ